MAVHPDTREHIEAYLTKAEFSLRVVAHTGCMQNTPALDNVKAALDQVARTRAWVREKMPVEPVVMKPYQAPLGRGLPQSRKQRLTHRWE